MNPDQWEAINEVFLSAIDLDPDSRKTFLDQACGENATIRQEVESLIAAHDRAGDFIRNSPSGISLPSNHSPEHLDPGSVLGHYRVEKIIGTGGMGEVYLASDTKLNRPVAIKRLPVHLSSDPAFLKRFRNEAQAAAILNHPNVATIHSIEEFEGEPFITMEYVEGRPLGAATPADGMDLRTFLTTFVDVADALQEAHEKGITHRDIKPGNIMISSSGVPKVLDFGLAQITAESPVNDTGVTQPGQVIGTPAYMSPEQAKGLEVDHRSDIFSLGVVMYEALTGLRPFRGSSHADVVANVLKLDPPPVDEIQDQTPPLVSRMIQRCIAKDKDDRFQTMGEVQRILADSKALLDAGVSTGSLGRRLYSETVSTRIGWRLAAAGLSVLIFAFIGWYVFSERPSKTPIVFEKVSMRRLSQANNVGYSVISPDGKSFAYATADDDDTRALWIRRVDDRNALQLVPPHNMSFWGGIVISEDGGQVYYLTADPLAPHGTLYRVSSLGGPPKKIVDLANDVGGLSPDGQRILFVRYGEPSHIMSANAIDGGD
ncbi:MAG TPA: protein kinase, partial [Pyrinomonadaceae bacterium]|nr:protein kinase [Pyrinomonadaceae bacterium]